MCEIQFLKRTDGENLNENDLKTFVKFMSLGDLGNSDAFGFFNSTKDFKSPGKFDYTKLNSQDIISDNFVVGHNRFATKRVCAYDEKVNMEGEEKSKWVIPTDFLLQNGMSPFSGLSYNNIHIVKKNTKENSKDKPEDNKKKESKKPKLNFNDNLNNHPFKLNDLVLVHNGVVSNVDSLIEEFKLKTEISTDSFVILFLIDKFLKEAELKDKHRSKKRERTQLIVDAIRKTTSLIKGFYSVFLFDKKEKKLYYFRDNIGSFYFYKPNKNIIIGSTDFKNFEYVYRNKEIYQDLIIPKPGKVYLIKDGKGKKNILEEVGIFREYIKKRKVKKKTRKEKKQEKKQMKSKWLKKLKGGKKKK